MRGRMIIGVMFLVGAIIGVLEKYFSMLIAIILIVVALLFLIRKSADVYWWGKDKGKW